VTASYKIGQVIYVVLRKEMKVYPMQVTEIITKKTLDGEVTVYMVRGGTAQDEVLPIDQIDGEVFDSPDRVKKTLIDRASASITMLVDDAATKAKEWYPSGFTESSGGIDDIASLRKPMTTNGQPVPLPVKQQKPKKQQPMPSPELAQLAAELQQDNSKLEMELPDGTKAKVRSIKVPPSLQG
jgi:hypothetical protein